MSYNLFKISIVLISLVVSGFASKHQHIGDCFFYDADYAGACNLTLICIDELIETNFFVPNVVSVCPKLAHTFDKYWIGSIDFKDCELTELPEGFFEVYYNVHTLNVSYLELISLQAENFVKSKNMTKFIASHNKINKIPSHLFAESNSLNEVDFSFNEINEIDADAFGTGNIVQMLNLAFNNISDLNIQLFKNLIELKQLHVSHNKIVRIPPLLFHSSDKLIDVDLSFNKITKIEDFALFGDVNLEKLNLSHNQITNFDRQILENHSHLTDLDISHNQIIELKSDTFKSLQNLLHLDISNNALNDINNKTFMTLVKLQHLNLSQTSLSQLRPATFLHQINLQTLDLTNNHIKALDSSILPTQLNQLKLLSVGNNQLKLLNGFTSSSFSKIVGVEGNRFECDFLDPGTEIITWKRLDTGSRPMACTFYNGNDERGNKPTSSSTTSSSLEKEKRIMEVVTEKIQHIDEPKHKQSSNSWEKSQSNGFNEAPNNNCTTRMDVNNNDSTNQFVVTTWMNTVGLIFIAIAMIWLIYRGNVIQRSFTNNSYWKSDTVPLDIAEHSA